MIVSEEKSTKKKEEENDSKFSKVLKPTDFFRSNFDISL